MLWMEAGVSGHPGVLVIKLQERKKGQGHAHTQLPFMEESSALGLTKRKINAKVNIL